jgi:O-antigen ligase
MRARLARKPRAGLAGWIGVDLLLSAELSGRATIANGLIGIAALVALANLARIRRTSLFVLPYVAYVILLALAVGSMPTTPHEIFTWLNGDGRIVIAVLPFVALGTLRITWADLQLFVKAIRVIVWADVLLYLAALAGVGPIHRIVLHRANFFGLTSSHHAAGYFASAAVLILWSARRTPILGIRPSLITVAAAAGLIVASGSRTSLIGLAGVAVWSLLSKRKASDILRVLALTIAGAAALLALGSRFSDTVSTFFSSSFRQQSIDTFKAGLQQHESVHYAPLFGSNAGYVANILARFWYWGIAVGLFLRSPILGIGSFRYNDINLHFSGIPHVLDFATSGLDNSADLEGAHDQFLGALVETGIVGLALLLMMWILPYRALRRSVNKPKPMIQSGCQMVPFAFATAFTGYTLAAPSLTFVAMTWLAFTVLVDEPEAVPDAVTVRRPVPPQKKWRRRGRVVAPRSRTISWSTPE